MEFLEIFKGLISGDQSVKENNFKKFLKLMRSLPKIDYSELDSRKLLFKIAWDIVFNCE